MNTDYRTAQKVLHWLMAFFIMLDLFIAQKFGGLMEDWDRLESRIDHASLGFTVLTLFLIRIILRIKYGAPKEPESMPDWQIKLSKAAHHSLYLLMALLFATGILTAANATSPIPIYGAFDITIGNANEDFFQSVRLFHELATQALIVLIGVHIFAALYHHFIVKDDVLAKMLRLRKAN